MSYYTRDNPYPPAVRYPRCPICGGACESVMRIAIVHYSRDVFTIGYEIVGCENCFNPEDYPGEDIFTKNSWEEPACMEEDR